MLQLFTVNAHTIAEITDDTVITTVQDALDIMATAQYEGASYVLLHHKHLTPDFFDLKTGLAGDILQKYVNYRMNLIIMGDFNAFTSSSLQAFIRESNRGNHVAFVTNKDAALKKIASHEASR